jgi:ATP-binding cassette subfamily C protein CydC
MGAEPGRRLVANQAELRAAAVDGIQGLPELLIHGAADAYARRLNAISLDLTGDQDRMARYTGSALGAVGLSANLALWAVLWIGIPLVNQGSLPPPDLAMLALFTLASFEAVAPLPQAFQQLGGTLAAARRLFALVDAEPAVREPKGPSPQPACYDLELDGVGFTYPGAERPALSDVHLRVPEGGRLAIVGATGSGKSTLFHLLLRFWEPDTGQIRLGGYDLARFRGEDVRRGIALVSQHTHLFNTSIRDNLLLAAPDAPQHAIERACEAARIHDFIVSLPEGYETWVGETGVRLSGGQARRISIARALLKDAPILLLDEPTEGLDAPTERELMAAVDRLMDGRTTLLITHRPVGLERMDQILVLDNGRVVGQGDHRSLLGTTCYSRLLRLRGG